MSYAGLLCSSTVIEIRNEMVAGIDGCYIMCKRWHAVLVFVIQVDVEDSVVTEQIERRGKMLATYCIGMFL